MTLLKERISRSQVEGSIKAATTTSIAILLRYGKIGLRDKGIEKLGIDAIRRTRDVS
jgi:hypothetical protein